jgi:hypothetical protein
MTKAEFEQSLLQDTTGLYILLRGDPQGQLTTVPYHEAYKAGLEQTGGLLRDAAELVSEPGFGKKSRDACRRVVER